MLTLCLEPVINNSTNLTNQVASFALAMVRNFRKSDAMYGRGNECNGLDLFGAEERENTLSLE